MNAFSPRLLSLGVILSAAFNAGHAGAQTAVPPPAATVPYLSLTAHERWVRYANETVLSPGLYFASAGAALGGQLNNDPPEWRQGAKGYGKRAASALGQFAMQTTIHEGGAALLGYDPRYTRCTCSGFWPRSAHAIKMGFVTYNREGKLRFDLPAYAGAYGSGMLAQYWYPQRFNPLTDGVRAGTIQAGFHIGLGVLREFGPELRRTFLRR